MAKRGGFFAVDKATWARVCPGLGLNASVAYLVLAAFSGADNETTAASVNAVEKYTGIARARAAAAIKALIDAGVVLQTQGGSRPRYKLIPHTAPAPAPKPARGRKPAASPPAPSAPPARAMVWLPNALVTGAKGETAPVERVRQTGDPYILRLLVDLYYGQNLRDDGGIARSVIHRKFSRVKVGEHGPFTVWGFTEGMEFVRWGELTNPHKREKLTPEEQTAGKNPAVDFFPRLQTLVDLGLVQWVPHLVESEDFDSEVIHPYVMNSPLGKGDMEAELGSAAYCAGSVMLAARLRNVDPGLWFAPLPKHYANAAMVGIARLRYRPHTSNTARWYGQLQELGRKYLERYAYLSAGRTDVFRLDGTLVSSTG